MINNKDLIVEYSNTSQGINIIFKDNQTEEEQKAVHNFLNHLVTNLSKEGE